MKRKNDIFLIVVIATDQSIIQNIGMCLSHESRVCAMDFNSSRLMVKKFSEKLSVEETIATIDQDLSKMSSDKDFLLLAVDREMFSHIKKTYGSGSIFSILVTPDEFLQKQDREIHRIFQQGTDPSVIAKHSLVAYRNLVCPQLCT